MATPMNTPSAGEIWHLSVDDLLAPLPARARLGGAGPFVINLSASTAPISVPLRTVVDVPNTHVYQIQRTEDRRMRYRLRLGPFATEDEADAVLETVRGIYPGALTATAEADDLRTLESLKAKADAHQVDVPAARPPSPIPVLTAVATSVEPRPASRASVRPVPPPPVERLSTHLSGLETTQTVRALTPPELEDHVVSRWYVVQLSLSEEAFDPDKLPNLDIFSVYRLYAVSGLDQGRIMHALRLGFFREEIAAAAVASYLAGFYEKPTVKRVSTAERGRFAEQRLEARKDIGATGMHALIEITGERIIREPRSAGASRPSNQSSVQRIDSLKRR
jgi:hypothetical protein